MTPGELIQKYVAMRDYLKAKAEARAEEDRPYVEGMQTIEGFFLDHLNKNDEQSIKTEFGTVYKTTSMSARVVDSEVLFNHVRDSDDFHLLVAGVAKDAVKTYMEEHQGTPPPGVDISFFTKVGFRRA